MAKVIYKRLSYRDSITRRRNDSMLFSLPNDKKLNRYYTFLYFFLKARSTIDEFDDQDFSLLDSYTNNLRILQSNNLHLGVCLV